MAMCIRAASFAWMLATVCDPAHAKRQNPMLNEQVKIAAAEEAATKSPKQATIKALVANATMGSESVKPEIAVGWSGLSKHFFAGLSTAILVKILCLAGNALVHVSPFSQVREWEGKGNTGDVDPSPYVSIGVGGWQWCTYGFAAWAISGNDKFLVLVYANCLGALCGSYYTFTFFRLCQNAEMWRKLNRYLKAVALVVLFQTAVWLVLPHQRSLQIHSAAAAFCSFLTSVSLLACLPVVARSQDASGICGPLVLANFFGALVWAYWGVLVQDAAIISVNVFAAFASAACLCMKLRYQTSSEKTCDEASVDGKMGLSWGMVGKRHYRRKNQPTPYPMKMDGVVTTQTAEKDGKEEQEREH